MAQALALGSKPPMQCHLGPQETYTTERRSLQAGRRVSKAQQATSPHRPRLLPGYLVHALQTTLWTFSLLFKSPPGERGKKNPEEIRVNWKEKFSKGCPQRRKSPDSADLQTTTRLSEGSGETASHTDLTRNPAPPATFPLSQAERTPVYRWRPPSWCWANTQAVKGHRRPASVSPFYTRSP